MIHHGDCLSVLRGMADNSLDACVTDPPYGLSFMGKGWDYDVPSVEIWREVFRVLKPGAHLLAFAGTRTQHRMAVNIEDAGFEVRDMIAWVYGSGFPKSHNLDGEWQGWGTALKPALEPITVARKPLIGTVAANVQTHGTGALNIDGCRIGNDERTFLSKGIKPGSHNIVGSGWDGDNGKKSVQGRWPANLIHDGSEEVLAGFPETGTGSAARFFYAPKASKSDRDEGLEGFEAKAANNRHAFTGLPDQRMEREQDRRPSKNHHPTVKPTDLMRYLCRLVTPPGGTVLDPFMGSGSTGKAAILEGFQFVGIEREAEYLEIARARIEHVKAKPRQEAML